ncbi:MAG: methyltransferase domain-containing protein [Kiritimatiellae bacterium]|nr:methyltransferase domain-containing protein [Kiritimatiellia bacterium]
MRLILLRQPVFKCLNKYVGNREFTLLDVGCGNRAPTRTKRLFPSVLYHGIDKCNYNNTAEDLALIDRLFELDLERDSLAPVPDAFYDAIVMNHVIEHLRNGGEVVAALTHKLKPDGILYIEFPSVRSLGFPSMRGTFNFCDDPTHVRVYAIHDLANVLLDNHCRVLRAGPCRDRIRALLFPVMLIRGLRRRNLALPFWYVTGFADHVVARRKQAVDDQSNGRRGERGSHNKGNQWRDVLVR